MDFKGMLMTIQSAIYVLLLVLFQEKKCCIPYFSCIGFHMNSVYSKLKLAGTNTAAKQQKLPSNCWDWVAIVLTVKRTEVPTSWCSLDRCSLLVKRFLFITHQMRILFQMILVFMFSWVFEMDRDLFLIWCLSK